MKNLLVFSLLFMLSFSCSYKEISCKEVRIVEYNSGSVIYNECQLSKLPEIYQDICFDWITQRLRDPKKAKELEIDGFIIKWKPSKE